MAILSLLISVLYPNLEAGLVKCLTHDEKIGRLYGLTEKGKEILKMIK